MTDREIHETKIKIMEAARVLFAEQGFDGASIREIAKAADVNIAAVNYHFSNKEGLFAEILRFSYNDCSQKIREMYDREKPNLEDATIFVFRFFLEKSHDLLTHFKIMMSSTHSHLQMSEGTGDEMIGPPGGQVFIEAIQKEVGKPVKEEDLHWALKTLFSHVTHTAMLSHCCFKQNNNIPFSSQADIEKGIRRLARIVVTELKGS